MIHLPSNPLDATLAQSLSKIQSDVDAKIPFVEKVAEAARSWDNKPVSVFNPLKSHLTATCISDRICNHCEQDEAADIEHIYPKSHFPEKSFQWDNYIPACKKCNTDVKNDHFAVFAPTGSTSIPLPERQKKGARIAPITGDGVLLNPRIEDPMAYLWLELRPINNQLLFVPLDTKKASRSPIRASCTQKLLPLNRSQLATSRYQAANYFISVLGMYVKVKTCRSFEALDEATNDFRPINTAIPFIQEQQSILTSLKADIPHYPHPTVWAELKRQRADLRKARTIFEQIPEALQW